MSHPAGAPLSVVVLAEENLVGVPIYGRDDRKIGSIARLHRSGPDAQAVVDVGGFLGKGARPVLMTLGELNITRDSRGAVRGRTNRTLEDLQRLPRHAD